MLQARKCLAGGDVTRLAPAPGPIGTPQPLPCPPVVTPLRVGVCPLPVCILHSFGESLLWNSIMDSSILPMTSKAVHGELRLPTLAFLSIALLVQCPAFLLPVPSLASSYSRSSLRLNRSIAFSRKPPHTPVWIRGSN